jgi:DNA-binding Lrp family transcriptional regulator
MMSSPNVDTLDLKILENLKRNARMDCKKIAQNVGLSDRTIARRIKKMEEKGIIKGYRVEVDRELIKSGLVQGTPLTPSEGFIEISATEWDGLASTIKNIFGVGGGVILFNIGLAIGRAYGRTLKDSLDLNKSIIGFSQTFNARGWGELAYSQIDYEKGVGRITISKIPFKNQVTDNVIKGIISGGLEEIFAKRVHVKKGDDKILAENTQKFIFEVSESVSSIDNS